MNEHDELAREIRDRAERLPVEIPSPTSAMARGRQRRRVSRVATALAAIVIAVGVAVPLRALVHLGEDPPPMPRGPSPSGENSTPDPTGTIAFIGGGQAFGPITLLDVASGLTEPLTKQSFTSVSLAWSPDGSLIAMTRGLSEGNGELVLVSTATGELTQTMPIDPLLNPQDVDWSPDGTLLAFTDTYATLHTIEPDGSHLRSVATDSQVLNIAFSPLGDEIAFVGDKGHLSVLDLETGVTTDVFSAPTKHRVWFGPTWSPDGSMLAFSMFEEGGSSINIVNADGTGFRQVLEPSHDGVSPTWSPDGNWIAFEGGGERGDLFAVTTDGATVRQLTDTGVGEFGPDWGTPELVKPSATGTAPTSAEYLPLVFAQFGNGWNVRNFDSVEEGTPTKAWASTVTIDARDLGPRKPAIPVHTIESLPPGEAVIVALATPWHFDPSEGPYPSGSLDPLNFSDATIRGPEAEEPEGDYTIYEVQNGYTAVRVFFGATPTGAELEAAQAELATLQVPPTCPIGYEASASPTEAEPGETVTLTGPMPFQFEDGSYDAEGRTIAIAWWNADEKDWPYLSSFSTRSPSRVASGPIVRLGEGGVGQCSFAITFTVPDVPPGDYPIVVIQEGPVPNPDGSALLASLSVRVG